jgi:hypothetical protein
MILIAIRVLWILESSIPYIHKFDRMFTVSYEILGNVQDEAQ